MIHGNGHARVGLDVPPQMVLRGHGRFPIQIMMQRQWDRRIRRANELTSTYPFAAEGLRFYSRVATFQKSLYADIAESAGRFTEHFLRRDLCGMNWIFSCCCLHFAKFLSLIQQIAPAPLAHAAAVLARKGTPGWQRAIEDFWHGDLDTAVLAGRPWD